MRITNPGKIYIVVLHVSYPGKVWACLFILRKVMFYPGKLLQCLNVLVEFFLSTVTGSVLFLHPPVVLKELVSFKNKVDDIKVPQPL